MRNTTTWTQTTTVEDLLLPTATGGARPRFASARRPPAAPAARLVPLAALGIDDAASLEDLLLPFERRLDIVDAPAAAWHAAPRSLAA